jgi:hypothetical protein
VQAPTAPQLHHRSSRPSRPAAAQLALPLARGSRALDIVPSGREVRTAGDARIRGTEQPARFDAPCRSLLRFVQLHNSDVMAC